MKKSVMLMFSGLIALGATVGVGPPRAWAAGGGAQRQKLVELRDRFNQEKNHLRNHGEQKIGQIGVAAQLGGRGVEGAFGIGSSGKHGINRIRVEWSGSFGKSSGAGIFAGLGTKIHSRQIGATDERVAPIVEKNVKTGMLGLGLGIKTGTQPSTATTSSREMMLGVGVGNSGSTSTRISRGFNLPFIKFKSRNLRLTERGEKLVGQALKLIDKNGSPSDARKVARLESRIHKIARDLNFE